jgi:hypothetical protein
MGRRTLKTHAAETLFQDMGLEKVAPGWIPNPQGLASSTEDLEKVLEEMRVIPPKIYNGPPPPPIPPPVIPQRVLRVHLPRR